MFLTILGIFLLAGVTFAQTETLPSAGITPDSPFYFLDTFGEQVQLFFAFSPAAKVETATKIAGEKVAEAKAMEDAGDVSAALEAAGRYGEMASLAAANLAEAAKSGEGFDVALAELVSRATSIHLEVLTGVLEKVPEQAQKTAIGQALENSEKVAETALKALKDNEDLKTEVQKKIDAARAKRGAGRP